MDLEEFKRNAPIITEKKAREVFQEVLLTVLGARASGAPLQDDQYRARLVDRGLWIPPKSERRPGELPRFKDRNMGGEMRMLTPRFH